MTIDQIVVTSAGLLAVAGVAWFSRGPRRAGVQAALTSTGVQETTLVVKGAYSPDLSVVDHGKPVRLSFLRQETAACSEEVIFPDFARRAELTEGELVPPHSGDRARPGRPPVPAAHQDAQAHARHPPRYRSTERNRASSQVTG